MTRKLWGKKTHFGYSHLNYKNWGQQGGRPKKWGSEAERKKWARQQKALTEGRELRNYRSYPQKVQTRTGELQKYQAKGWNKSETVFSFQNRYTCPKCGVRLTFSDKNSSVKTWTSEYGQQIDQCRHCGYAPTQEEIIYRAGTSTERSQRNREKEEDDENEEEDEEED